MLAGPFTKRLMGNGVNQYHEKKHKQRQEAQYILLADQLFSPAQMGRHAAAKNGFASIAVWKRGTKTWIVRVSLARLLTSVYAFFSIIGSCLVSGYYVPSGDYERITRNNTHIK